MCESAPERATPAFAFGSSCPCCAALPPIEYVGPDPPLLLGVKLLDSHSHIHKVAADGVGRPPSYNAVLAIEESCWDAVLARCAIIPHAAPGLGVHPWFVHELAPGWTERLRAKLEVHPGAIVGEIGLCKCARNLRGPGAKSRFWPVQVDAFTTQLGIAGALRRPASVHCVKAHSTLIEVLQQQADALPPAIALHSFSGTLEHVRLLLALHPAGILLYFGFSHTVNVAMGGGPGSPAYEGLLAAIRAVPEERLLVESDCDSEASASDALRRAVQLVADARGWTAERAANVTTANGLHFLQSGSCGQEAREDRSLRQAQLELAASMASDDPSSVLRATVETFRDAGMSQDELCAMLEALRTAHDSNEDETIYDAVVDTLDFVVGWCPRGNGLYPDATIPRELYPTWPSAREGAECTLAVQAQWRYLCAMAEGGTA